MKVKNDHRSKFSNLSNWKEEAWKKSGLQRDSNPWPPRYRCVALPTELWSHTLGARSIYWVHISREEWNDVKYIRVRISNRVNMTGKWGSGEKHGKLELVRVIWVIQYKQCYAPMTPYRPVTRILCGGVLTRPKRTQLRKCIFLSSDPFI